MDRTVATAPVLSEAAPKSAAGAQPWVVAGLLTACFTLSYVDRQLISILVGPIKATLGLSDTQIGLLQGVSFSLFYVAASLPLASLSDRGNRAHLVSACVAVWSGMTMGCGLAFSYAQLLLARIGVASAEAGLPPAALTLMADLFEPRRLVRATSLFMLAPYLGGGLALLGGGSLYAASAHWQLPALPLLGALERWQWLFILVGAPGLVLAVFAAFMRDPRQRRPVQVDSATFADLLRFMRRERRIVLTYMVSIALTTMMLNAYTSWLPASLIRSKGIDERAVGQLFGPVFLLAGAAGTLSGGMIIGREGEVVGRTLRYMRWCALLLLPLAVVGPQLTSLPGELALIGAAIFMISTVLGLSSLPLQYLAPSQLRARAIAVLALISALGGTGLGPVAVGLLSDHLRGTAQPLPLALSVTAAIAVPLIVLNLHVAIAGYRRKLSTEHPSQ